jgi:hypothetical protein
MIDNSIDNDRKKLACKFFKPKKCLSDYENHLFIK